MPRNGYLPPPPAYLAVFAVMPRCGRTRTQERKRSSPRKGKTQPRKSMHPSVSSSCVICLLWRFIGLNDSKSLRPTQAGILEIEVLRVFWDVNARQHRNAAWKAALPVRRLARRARPTLRPRRSAALPLVVSMSHVTPAGLGSQVSCPRAHAHLAGCGHMRGTPLIAIGEIAGMRREIMVRNANYGSNQGKSYWSNGFSRGTSIPTMSFILRVTSVIP